MKKFKFTWFSLILLYLGFYYLSQGFGFTDQTKEIFIGILLLIAVAWSVIESRNDESEKQP